MRKPSKPLTHRGCARINISVLLLFLAAFQVPATSNKANDDLFFLTPASSQITLADSDLLANDEAGLVMVSWAPPSRGQLQRQAAGFTYTPSLDFWLYGSDSFRYWVDGTEGGQESAIVLLIAEPGMQTVVTEDLEAGLTDPAWILVGQPTPAVNLTDPISGLGDLRVESNGSATSILHPQAFDHNQSSEEVETKLDPCGFIWPLGGELTVIRIADSAGSNLYELVLGIGDGYHEIQGRARRLDGSLAVTPWTRLPGGIVHLRLLGWPATAARAADGGLLVFLDGAMAVGIHGTFGGPNPATQASVGVLDPTPGVTGVLRFDELRLRQSSGVPFYPPLFADGLESGDLGAWDGSVASGLLEVTAAAAISGQWGLAARVEARMGSAYLRDTSADDESHYRARLTLDGRDLNLVSGEHLVILRGVEPGSSEFAFDLELRTVAGADELRLVVWLDDGSRVELQWCSLPASGPATVELQWWAGDSPAGGGARLWLAGLLAGEVYGLNNDASSLDEVRLGAVAASQAAAGRLYLDDFESWR